jgi:hypothetical protein
LTPLQFLLCILLSMFAARLTYFLAGGSWVSYMKRRDALRLSLILLTDSIVDLMLVTTIAKESLTDTCKQLQNIITEMNGKGWAGAQISKWQRPKPIQLTWLAQQNQSHNRQSQLLS